MIEDRRKPMKSHLLMGIICLALAGPAFLYSQSLTELAEQEKERRDKQTEAAKVITNDDTAKYKNAAIATGGITKPEASEDSDAEAESKAEMDEPVDLNGRPESFWRQTFEDVHRKISRLEDEATALTLKLNDLYNQLNSAADEYRRQAVHREIQKSIYMQDKNKEDLAEAKKQLAELKTEARKSGAPPGWTK